MIDTTGPVLIEKSFIVEAAAGQPARIVVDLVQTSPDRFLSAYRNEEILNDAAVAAVAQAAAAESSQGASARPAVAPAQEPAALPGQSAETSADPLPLPPPERWQPSKRRDGRKLVVEMKELKGKGNPQVINDLVKKELGL